MHLRLCDWNRLKGMEQGTVPRSICLILAAVLLLGQRPVAADELFDDAEGGLAISEYENDASSANIGTGAGDAGSDATVDDDAAFIEEGFDWYVQEGADLEELYRLEDEAAAAVRDEEGLIDTPALTLPLADAGQLAEYLKQLLQMPSPTGSDGELVVGRYIEETMKNLGYTVQEHSFHEGFLNEQLVDVPGMNIVAERGADAEESGDGILLICGHYDSKTLPAADGAGPVPAGTMQEGEKPEEITEDGGEAETAGVPGEAEASGDPAETAGMLKEEAAAPEEASEAGGMAKEAVKAADPLENDKSGAAVMLEAARLISGTETAMDICFVFLSGEEDGHFGALRFAESLEEDIRSRVRAVICIGPCGYQTRSGSGENETIQALPYLLGTSDGTGNEPASLLRATALYQYADSLLPGGTDEWYPVDEAGVDSFDESADAEYADGLPPSDMEVLDPSEAGQYAEAALPGEPADWSVVQVQEQMNAPFDAIGFESVLLFQDAEGILKEDYSASGNTGEAAAKSEQETEEMQTKTADTAEAEDSRERTAPAVWLDVPGLTGAADVLAQTIGMYMQMK